MGEVLKFKPRLRSVDAPVRQSNQNPSMNESKGDEFVSDWTDEDATEVAIDYFILATPSAQQAFMDELWNNDEFHALLTQQIFGQLKSDKVNKCAFEMAKKLVMENELNGGGAA